MRHTPIKTGTQLIFPVLRIGDFFCVFLRYQIVINCVFSYFNWVITQIRSLIKVLRSTRVFAPKMFFRSFKVTNANIETKLEQMCCIHTRLVVCAQEHNDFSGGSP